MKVQERKTIQQTGEIEMLKYYMVNIIFILRVEKGILESTT